MVVVAVGWKCTPRGHEPLHALFGLGDFRHQERRSRSRRHRSSRAREQQWYGGEQILHSRLIIWLKKKTIQLEAYQYIGFMVV